MDRQSIADTTQGWRPPGKGRPLVPGHPLSARRDSEVSSQQDHLAVEGDFAIEGPWAGVRQIVLAEYQRAGKRRDLVDRHSYELAYVLPELRRELNIRNLTLTELSPRGEKVRNYPADRAYRVVNGLVDFLTETRREVNPKWRVEVHNADRLAAIARRFFLELLRRRRGTLGIDLVLKIESTEVTGLDELLAHGATLESSSRRSTETGADMPVTGSPKQAELEALALEKRVENDPLQIEINLPKLIRLWETAGSTERCCHWYLWGLDIYNNLGLYEDALVYGEKARTLSKDLGLPVRVRWTLFSKLLMSKVGTGRAEEGLELAAEWSLEEIDDPLRGAQYCYLMAMLYARHLAERDLGKARHFLDEGMKCIEASNLPPADFHFHYVFNRNGMALIEHLEKSPEKAITLCEEGWDRLETHLSPQRHQLHRSVLLYNQAQVYAGLGMNEKALALYDATLDMDPNFSEYHNERANLLLRMGRIQDALVSYQTAVDLSPPYPEVYGNLGQCHRLLGDWEAALSCYSIALDLDPNQAFSFAGRGEVREMTGDLEGAMEDYRVALDLRPTDWATRTRRAMMLYERGGLIAAEEDLRRAVDDSDNRPDLIYNHAVVLVDLERVEAARARFERYLELLPDAEDRLEVEEKIRELSISRAS